MYTLNTCTMVHVLYKTIMRIVYIVYSIFSMHIQQSQSSMCQCVVAILSRVLLYLCKACLFPLIN